MASINETETPFYVNASMAQPPFLTAPLSVGVGNNGNYFYGANTGSGVGASIENMVGQPFAVNGLNRETFAAGQFGATSEQCRRGAKNVDSQCTCPGTGDSAPWQQQPAALIAANFNEAIHAYAGPSDVPDCVGRHLIRMHGQYGPQHQGPSQWTHY
jgi:hypothetical protein